MTRVIYDTTGKIFDVREGYYDIPVGIPFLEVEVPEGKRLIGIDVSTTPHTPIFEDYPLSEIEVLKEKATSSEEAINELTNMLIMISMK